MYTKIDHMPYNNNWQTEEEFKQEQKTVWVSAQYTHVEDYFSYTIDLVIKITPWYHSDMNWLTQCSPASICMKQYLWNSLSQTSC